MPYSQTTISGYASIFQVGFKYTGRRCTAEGCNGHLKDQVLDWEDALPEDELTASEKAAAEADLAICLGTSLQITPACNIPLMTVKAGRSLNKIVCKHTRLISHLGAQGLPANGSVNAITATLVSACSYHCTWAVCFMTLQLICRRQACHHQLAENT